MLAQCLASASCCDPFQYLGLQPSDQKKSLKLTVWAPNKSFIEVGAIGTSKPASKLKLVDPCGLFSGDVPEKFQHTGYQLWSDDHQVYIDPYQFQIPAFQGLADLYQNPRHLPKILGAQHKTVMIGNQTVKGVRFIVYAPSATCVSVIGDFNRWDGRCHPMQRSQCGHWVLFIPELKNGERYKFELKDLQGHVLPHKSDPVGFSSEQYPSFASLVYDHSSYQWQDRAWLNRDNMPTWQKPISIYEVHLGSWKRHKDGRFYSYAELADSLIPYVQDMGFTHIELMPISEHPYFGSWGYQPTGLFSPTSRFGSPDAFKAFVDQCHQAGIGVIIDWVPAHFPCDGHGLACFDGTTLYEYEDPRRGWHPDWNSLIYDYGRDHVRLFLVASALYWFEYFHIDGIRVDAVASMIYHDYSRKAGEWIPNIDGGNTNYEAISLLRWLNELIYEYFPHAITIAEESTAFPGVSKPTYANGLGFGFKWNMGWMHDTLEYMQKEPVHRKFHHHEMTFAMVYHYNENFILPFSHDEVVHGKKSLLYKMPGDEWQQAANLRALMGFMYAHPGKKLLFMGSELAQGEEWKHQESLHWWLLQYPKHQGQQKLIKDLNHRYRKEPALYVKDQEQDGFIWLDHQDSEHSIFAWARSDGQTEILYVISNFTPIPRDSYRLGVDQLGAYQVILNTDHPSYYGSGYLRELAVYQAQEENWQGQPCHINLAVPPLATIWIKQMLNT